jgi:hypothetical protein
VDTVRNKPQNQHKPKPATDTRGKAQSRLLLLFESGSLQIYRPLVIVVFFVFLIVIVVAEESLIHEIIDCGGEEFGGYVKANLLVKPDQYFLMGHGREPAWTHVEWIFFVREVVEKATSFSGKRVIVGKGSRDAGIQFRQVFLVTLPVDFGVLISDKAR